MPILIVTATDLEIPPFVAKLQYTSESCSRLKTYTHACHDIDVLFRTKGVLTEFIYMGRAEMGLYQTLVRLKAHVPTSQLVRKYLGR